MDTFNSNIFGEMMTSASYMDQSAFDEKFEIELANDYIRNIYHIENKYLVPVLEGGYREMYQYCKNHLIHPADKGYDKLMDPDLLEKRFEEENGILKAEFREMLVDGSFRWVQYIGITGAEHGVPEGKIYFYVYDIQNQKDRMEGRTSIRKNQKERDYITGLRKREAFVPAMIEKLAQATGSWCCVAIDIQHFKIFNTWFGYEKGDYLLSRIGNYLAGLEKEEDAVAAYFGRDNFALLIRCNRKKIEKIYATIRDFIFSYSKTFGFLPALGVCILENGVKPGFETYDNARLAVEDAKKNYLERICYFDASEYEKTRVKFEFLTEFQKAMMNEELTFYVQPQCRIFDGKIVGGEALARWIRKDGSVISPGAFVPVLEADGFITELDKYIWNCVCRWIRSLLDRNILPLPVSINVSQIDLLSMDVAAYLYSLTENYHIPPNFIKVEITESAYAENYHIITDTITELKKRGFLVFLDDFGAGYSSLSMLDRINVDVIKLDMLFMRKENSLGKKGIGIVESIFGMTKALELPVIVEGVENEDQVRFLRNLGFKYAQGYYFYKPVSIEAFELLLNDSACVDRNGLEMATSDLFRAQEFLKENMFTESTLNRILGAVAYYTLEGKNLTISRFNEPFREAIGDVNMDSRIENIQNYVVSLDHPVLYHALVKAEENPAEGSKCEIRFIKSDGSIFWFRMNFYYLRDDGNRKLFFGKVEDITEQREQSLHFFDVLRKQSDVTMCIELDKNKIQYITGENTLYQVDLPSMELDKSVYQTALNRIDKETDRRAFLEFFDGNRLREAYKKAVYHEVLNIDFRLLDKPEPMEFSTYYIRYNRDDSLIVYAFAKTRDRELLSMDSLTGMKNRYAYNETIAMLEAHGRQNDKLIVFSMDVNGLKSTNDTYGHMAGDELIKAAADGINKVMSPYGSGFRIGGDEFVAFVYGDKELAEYLKEELNQTLSCWSGELVRSVSISCGFATLEEFPDCTISELLQMADLRMYRAKSQYYQKLGVDRRMQQVAFNAMCNSYTKILRVNLTEDSFEIIQVDEGELIVERGYSGTISGWLAEFAKAEQVHPEDKEHYLRYTALDYLREYFYAGKKQYSITYRRLINGKFSKVMMEIIPAPDYKDSDQKVFLYVKDIGNAEII